MSLAAMASETVQICERGWYVAPSGARVAVSDAVARAVAGTRLYRPEDYAHLELPVAERTTPAVEVTDETTSAAARRLVQGDGASDVAALNFASAKNAGGGFLRGARAQEEDLARCSALYACQVGQREYYDANRAFPSMLYTDHLIYSPNVPFFRNDDYALLSQPFCVTLLTSPAPNAGEASRRGEGHLVRQALERRARQVLTVAAHHRHRTVVLGAWGCGVFRNDPRTVADVFARLLADASFAGHFARVVFAIYDRSAGRTTLRAFAEQFGGAVS
jgi:uncharacterized protein (TIGR02452 family)